MAVEMVVMGRFVMLADVLEEGNSYFFVFKVLEKSRLWGVFFEAWVSDMEEPMLNCKKSKFFGILGFFLDFERGG